MNKSNTLQKPASKRPRSVSPNSNKFSTLSSKSNKQTKSSSLEKPAKNNQATEKPGKSKLQKPKTSKTTSTLSQKVPAKSKNVSPSRDVPNITKPSSLNKVSGSSSPRKEFTYIKTSPSNVTRSNSARVDPIAKTTVVDRSNPNKLKLPGPALSSSGGTLPKNVKFSESVPSKTQTVNILNTSKTTSQATSISTSSNKENIAMQSNKHGVDHTTATTTQHSALPANKTQHDQNPSALTPKAINSTNSTLAEEEHLSDPNHPDKQLHLERRTSGHLISAENVGAKENRSRRLFVGIARSLAYMQMAANDQQAKMNKENEDSDATENSDEETSVKPKSVLSKKRPTLLSLASTYRKQNVEEYKEEQRRFNFYSLDYENPFLTAYYKHLEEETRREKERERLAKQEMPLVFLEITYNHPWNKSDENQVKENPPTKTPKTQTGTKKSEQKKADEKLKEKVIKPSHKNKKLTFKSLDADGYSIFDNEETSGDRLTEAKDEERGTKSELLIRIKKALYLNNWLVKNEIEDCQLGYVKCYLYSRPGVMQRPRKQRSNNCYISKTGKTYWDHIFILRGFSIDELKHLYMVINVKGKYRERYQDAVDDDLTPSTPQEKFAHKRDQFVHAIKRRNISLGEIVLAGEEAKIYPFTAGALMFRDTVKEEIEGWRAAFAQPGTTHYEERRLLPHDEELSPLTTITHGTPPGKPQGKQKWQSLLGKVSRSKKSSPSSSISS